VSAKGTKSTAAMISEYLAILYSSAIDTTDPASVLLSCVDVRLREGIKACGVPRKISTSLPRNFTMKLDSIRSLSSTGAQRVHVSACDSRVAEVPVLVKARHSRSLSWLWRHVQWRPEPRQQDRPWWPSTVIVGSIGSGTNNGSSETKTAAISIVSLLVPH